MEAVLAAVGARRGVAVVPEYVSRYYPQPGVTLHDDRRAGAVQRGDRDAPLPGARASDPGAHAGRSPVRAEAEPTRLIPFGNPTAATPLIVGGEAIKVAHQQEARMDRVLVERAMAGDHEAFSELTRLSVAKLYAIARLILRDGERAEDATQEALVAAWRRLPTLRDPDRFDAWMRRLLVHACYREAAQSKRRRARGGRASCRSRGRVRTRAPPSPTRTSSSVASRDSRPSSGPSSCCTSTWDCRCRRPRRSSASPSAPSSPDSPALPSRCAQPSMPTRACHSSKGG